MDPPGGGTGRLGVSASTPPPVRARRAATYLASVGLQRDSAASAQYAKPRKLFDNEATGLWRVVDPVPSRAGDGDEQLARWIRTERRGFAGSIDTEHRDATQTLQFWEHLKVAGPGYVADEVDPVESEIRGRFRVEECNESKPFTKRRGPTGEGEGSDGRPARIPHEDQLGGSPKLQMPLSDPCQVRREAIGRPGIGAKVRTRLQTDDRHSPSMERIRNCSICRGPVSVSGDQHREKSRLRPRRRHLDDGQVLLSTRPDTSKKDEQGDRTGQLRPSADGGEASDERYRYGTPVRRLHYTGQRACHHLASLSPLVKDRGWSRTWSIAAPRKAVPANDDSARISLLASTPFRDISARLSARYLRMSGAYGKNCGERARSNRLRSLSALLHQESPLCRP